MKLEYKKAIINIIFSAIILVGFLLIVPRIWIYFLPFIIAWIISLCASPIVQFLEKRIKIKRKMGSAIVIISVIALIALLFYGIVMILINQLAGWITSFPDVIHSFNKIVAQIQYQLVERGFIASDKVKSFLNQSGTELMKSITEFANGSSKLAISFVSDFTKQIPFLLIGIIVTLLSSYFFVSEKRENDEYLKKVVPEAIMKKIQLFKKTLQEALGGYLKAQFKIIAWVFLILVIGLFILKVKYTLVIAFLIACLDFLPILGAGMVMVPWAIISFLYHDFTLGVGLLIVWAVTQTFRQLIQPKYMGESIGMKPLPTLILLYFGYCVGGMAGLILAVPIGYVFINMIKAGAFHTTYESIKILVIGFNNFRKMDKDDIKKSE